MNENIKTEDKARQMALWAGAVVLGAGASESEPGKGMMTTVEWIRENIDANGEVEASLRVISLDTGKSTGTIQSALAELKRAGFLTFVSGMGRQVRKYTLTIPDGAIENEDTALWAGAVAFHRTPDGEVPSSGMLTTAKWIVEHVDGNGIVEASLRNISLDTGKHPGTTQSSLAELKRAGFLTLVSGAGRQARKYRLALAE